MYASLQEQYDGYAFRFLQNVEDPVVQLGSVGHERCLGREYFFDNKSRFGGWLLQYTVSGCGTVRVGDEIRDVPPGSAFLVSLPGEACYYFDEGRFHDPWEFFYMIFDGAPMRSYCEYILARHQGPVLALGAGHPAAEGLIRLHKDARSGALRDPFSAGSRVFDLVCRLCAPHAEYGAASPLVDRATRYLQENFRRSISLQDACKALCVSQSHLSRAFSHETGLHPIQYLTRLRLEEAVRLLNGTTLPLADISRRSGFADANYFSKVFKKHLRQSPRDFRRQMQSQPYTAIQL